MQTLFKLSISVVTALTCLAPCISHAECPSEPSFDEATFLSLPYIPELNLDFALQWTDSAAGLFIQPFDAVILHLDVDGQRWDVYIFSDIGMNRLTTWVCTGGDGRYERELLSITEYCGEDAYGFSMPSGLTTNAAGRLFDPEYDLVYLADRGNDRIVEIGLEPDPEKNECRLFFVDSFGENDLQWPVDIAISAYGERSDADFYVVDLGHERNTGSLIRFNMDGNYEYDTGYICHERTGDTLFAIYRPVSVACAPDESSGLTDIYISEADGPLLFGLSSNSDDPPQFLLVQNLMVGKGFWDPGGIAIDGCGRIYIANRAARVIENYGPTVGCYYLVIGEGWEPGVALEYPSNIIIDTYYGYYEALVIEKYFRQSGLRTFIVGNDCGSRRNKGGFVRKSQVIPPVQASPQLPLICALHDPYPNPFNSECKISFSLPEESHVTIEVFDALGRKVVNLLDKTLSAGEHSVTFDATELSSGTYFYKMTAGRFSQTKQMVLVK